MNRGLLVLIVIIAGVGVFIYSTNVDIKTKLNTWIGITQVDSLQDKSDTIPNKPLSTQRVAKKKRIPKTIKPDKYAYLDKYARETPEKYAHENTTLAKYLGKPAKNDLEKARLIYSWIATHIRYDDEAFNTEIYKDESADSVLIRRTAVCEGFSSLFQELGLLMGLEVKKISGYAKGYGYRPGDKITSIDHAWNAAKIDDTWRLIDVTWGSQESKSTDKGLKTIMKYDPYWFCVPPEEFIFAHLPEDNDWQLISPAITIKQYEELPFLNNSFFKMGFDSKEILKKAISGEIREFVETFYIDYPVKAIELPFTRKILRGKEYSFSLESEYLEKVVIVDGEQWIDLKKEGNIFKINHTPKGDKFQIAVKVNWYENKVSTIAVYDIMEEKI